MRAATIYLVTNLENGHCYVGLTRFTCKQRWKEHLRNAKRGLKTYLYSAVRKYGAESFRIMDIASCLSLDTAVDVERAVIQSIRPEYNQTNGGEFTFGKRVPRHIVEKIIAANTGKKRTAEYSARNAERKKAWFIANPDARKKNADHLAHYRSLPEVQAKRISGIILAAKEGKMSRVLSPDRIAIQLANMSTVAAKAKMAASKCKMVECTTLNVIFDSISEAAEFTNQHISTVSKACLGKLKSANKLKFKYVGALS